MESKAIILKISQLNIILGLFSFMLAFDGVRLIFGLTFFDAFIENLKDQA